MKLILALLFLCACPYFGYAGKKVLLSSVQTLTLHNDKFTTGRRSSPIPQLRCIDGKSSCANLPSSVQCYNMGSDGIDVQWKCEAQLSKNTQFDTLQVQCEGYNYPDDPYILVGSCGLTYSLKPSGSGGSSGGSRNSHKSRSGHKSRSHSSSSDTDSSVSPLLVIAVLAVAGFGIYAFCLAPYNQHSPAGPTAPPPPAYDDADDERPPPYSEGGPGAPQYGFRPEFTAGASGGSGKAYERRSYQQQQQRQYQEQEQTQQAESNSGPGFWTGTAVGGLAGYLFGSSRSGGGGGGYYGAGSRDYHYGGGGGYHGNTYAPPPPSSSSSASSVDDSPVTRTGYASTRRR